MGRCGPDCCSNSRFQKRLSSTNQTLVRVISGLCLWLQTLAVHYVSIIVCSSFACLFLICIYLFLAVSTFVSQCLYLLKYLLSVGSTECTLPEKVSSLAVTFSTVTTLSASCRSLPLRTLLRSKPGKNKSFCSYWLIDLRLVLLTRVFRCQGQVWDNLCTIGSMIETTMANLSFEAIINTT